MLSGIEPAQRCLAYSYYYYYYMVTVWERLIWAKMPHQGGAYFRLRATQR